MAGVSPCYSSIRCETLDAFVESKILEALAPAGIDLSLRVIEDEKSRRAQLETLHSQRVEQARFAVESSERRYRHVDPANRLVAARLESEWEASLLALESVSQQLRQFRDSTPVHLSDVERDRLRLACNDVAQLWRSESALMERKQLARLLLTQVHVDVQNNSEQVHVTSHWSGGYGSVHQITRTVQQFDQLDCYQNSIDRALELTLSGHSAPQVAETLQQEGFRCPRHITAISPSMVNKLLHQDPRSHKQLTAPELPADHWLAHDLAHQLAIPAKRLKDWVTRGWAIAAQRPHGRVWVILANEQEVTTIRPRSPTSTGRTQYPHLRIPRKTVETLGRKGQIPLNPMRRTDA